MMLILPALFVVTILFLIVRARHRRNQVAAGLRPSIVREPAPGRVGNRLKDGRL